MFDANIFIISAVRTAIGSAESFEDAVREIEDD